MRFLLIAATIVSAVVTASAQSTAPASGAPLPATDVTSAQMLDFLNALPKDKISDSPVRIVDVGGSRIGIYGVFRPKSLPGDAVLHETRTSEVYVMLDGAATLVTGGSLAGRKPGPTGGTFTTVRGTGIDGGVTRRIVKGDVVIIPGGTPHWWSHLEGDIKYMIVRSDPESRMTLK
jgi:mannose-6-phosphate isomerase-like protein (cupin superfamily)